MSDPTFQKSGTMTAYTRQSIPSGLIKYAEVSSFPHDAPPPPWTEGNQWTALYPKGATIPFQYQRYGALPFLKINDLSNQSIPENKGYAFAAFAAGGIGNSVGYFELHGVAGGSTVLPGFGLYNLVSNPKAWTYIKPQNFTGIFTLSWLFPYFLVPVTATVQYAPPQDSWNTGRLMYSWDYVYQYYPPSPNDKYNDVDAACSLMGASDEYDMVKLPRGMEPDFGRIDL